MQVHTNVFSDSKKRKGLKMFCKFILLSTYCEKFRIYWNKIVTIENLTIWNIVPWSADEDFPILAIANPNDNDYQTV